MNTDKSIKLNIFVKFIPIIIYYVIWIIDVRKDNPLILDIFSGLFAGTFSLVLEGWALVFFEIYLFVAPKRTAKLVMGIISIVLSVLNALWMYFMNEFIFTFAGYWRPTLVILLCMNFVYMVVAALILAGKVRA